MVVYAFDAPKHTKNICEVRSDVVTARGQEAGMGQCVRSWYNVLDAEVRESWAGQVGRRRWRERAEEDWKDVRFDPVIDTATVPFSSATRPALSIRRCHSGNPPSQ
jgi:hypothetical protein